MKTLNFWRTLLYTVVAAAAFTACSDEKDEQPNGGAPSITVNDGPTANVGVTLEGVEKTEAIAVVSSGKWTLTYSDGASAWVTPSATSGSGKSSLTFKIAANTEPREATITLTTKGSVAGFEITKSATIVIKQSKGGSSGTAIYSNNFDVSKVEKDGEGRWPFLDQTEVWKNATGTGNSTVTYESTNVSVRSSGKLSGGYPGASGVNKIFFGTAPATFSIDKITLPAGAKDFKLVFGGAFSKQTGEDYDNIFKPASFHVTLGNGTAWSGDVTYTKIGGGDTVDPFWVYFEANFTLPEAISALSVKFTADLPSGFAIDDVVLTEGEGGQEISFAGGGEEFPLVTINNLAAGKFQVDGTIVGVHSKGVMLADNAGGNVNYVMSFFNGGNTYADKLNYSANVKGTCADRFGLWQFAEPTLTVGSATTFELGTPANFDAAAIEAYKTAVAYKYVTLTGVLSITNVPASGTNPAYNTYNVAVSGSDVPVNLAYGIDSYFAGISNGDVVNVKGFAIGYDTKKISVMAREVSKNTSTPSISGTPASVAFAAAGETKTIAFTVANAGSNKVYAKVTGTDAASFPVAAGEKTSPISIAVAANAGAAKSATLRIYLAASENGAEVAGVNVALSQAAKSTGEDTKGTFTSMAQFISTGDQFANPCGLGTGATANSKEASGFKIGSSSKCGSFTSTAVGVIGNKTLGFYAVAWKGKTATLNIKVDGGGSASVATVNITPNDTATGNPPFALASLADADYYTVQLTGLTATSTVSISTSATFDQAANSTSGRAIICGAQLF